MVLTRTSVRVSLATYILAQLLIPISAHAESASKPLLVKSPDSSAVYWIQGTQRRPFPLLSVYRSWFGNSFADVKVISSAELSSYQLGKNILFKSGSLIKIQTDPKVYLVNNETGSLEWIKTEQEFLSRWPSFSLVNDVPDTFFPDYTPTPTSDFATPQNGQNENDTTTDTTTNNGQNTTQPPFALNDLSVSSFRASDAAYATFTFTTTEPASATVTLVPSGGATSTYALATATSFTKTVPVQNGVSYTYSIVITKSDGSRVERSGSFIGYADVVMSGIMNLVPARAPLAKPEVLVGGFTINNKSQAPRTVTELVFQFDSESSVTRNVAKTIQIVRLTGNNAIGDVVTERTIGSGVAITNFSNLQRIALEETLASGETRRYGIVIKNLDQINVDLTSPSESFVTKLAGMSLLGDTTYAITEETLASLSYSR